MSAKAGASNLVQATKDLSLAWQQAKSQWLDAKSREFERVYLESLPAQVSRATAVMEEIDILLRKIRSECE